MWMGDLQPSDMWLRVAIEWWLDTVYLLVFWQ